MKTVYPVLFTKTESHILIEIPDLEILTEGSDMSNAIDMARDAIELTCVFMEDNDRKIPKPSEALDVNGGTFSGEGTTVVSFVDADTDEYRKKNVRNSGGNESVQQKAPAFLNMALMSEEELHAELQKGYDDVMAGRVKDAESVFEEFRKYDT